MVNASLDIIRCIYTEHSGMDSRDGLPRGILPSGILKMKKILSGPGCSSPENHLFLFAKIVYEIHLFNKLLDPG